MQETMPQKSSRTFSKWMVAGNVLAIWAVVIVGIVFHEAEHVVGPAFGLIGVLFGSYVGVGHLDFRKAVQMQIDQLVKGNGR